jgi:hypothetical protein
MNDGINQPIPKSRRADLLYLVAFLNLSAIKKEIETSIADFSVDQRAVSFQREFEPESLSTIS